MECPHDFTTTKCDGLQHVTVCVDCGEVLKTEPCEEAGTWPTEER